MAMKMKMGKLLTFEEAAMEAAYTVHKATMPTTAAVVASIVAHMP